MTSVQSKLLELLLRSLRLKEHYRSTPPRGQPGASRRTPPPKWLDHKYALTSRRVNGHTVWTLAPQGARSDHHLYFLHGGGYVKGFAREHWRFLGRLVEALHCTITAPDYPLPPAYHADDVFALVLPLYQELIRAVDPAKVVILGDSAGGGMSLALAQLLRAKGVPQPAALILLSPWLDVTMTNPDIAAVAAADPWLRVENLINDGARYAGPTDRRAPQISPIYGSVRGLAPITLFVGTHDLLVADCRKFRRQSAAEGIQLDYYEYAGMVHVWMLLPLPEARQAITEIVQIVRRA